MSWQKSFFKFDIKNKSEKKRSYKQCQKFIFWENKKIMLCCTTTIPRLSQINIWVKSGKILKAAKKWFVKKKITKNSIFNIFGKKCDVAHQQILLHIHTKCCYSTITRSMRCRVYKIFFNFN